MNNMPYRVHVVWLGGGIVPYPEHMGIMRSVLGNGWHIMLWTKDNIPFPTGSKVHSTLLRLIDNNLAMASLYYRVALLEQFAGFSLSYNTRLDKHVRPLQLFCMAAGGLVVAHKPPTYTGPDYLGTDVLMCERINKKYPNSFNLIKQYWSRKYCRHVEGFIGPVDNINPSTSLTSFFNSNAASDDRQGQNDDAPTILRRDKPCRIRGVQVLSHKYFYDPDLGKASMGLVLPNLGY